MSQVFRLLMIGLLVTCLAATGCARKKKGKKGLAGTEMVGEDIAGSLGTEDLQLAALKGEDIPLPDQIEAGTFVEPGEVGVFEDVLFDYDDYQIRDEYRQTLDNIYAWLEEKSRRESHD